jgi:hypothetical protein
MIKFISIDNMKPTLQVDATSEQRARELPKPAYDGQDNLSLAIGMDNYAVDSTEKFYNSYGILLNLYTVENAKVLFGTGVDGVIIDKESSVIAEPSCFHSPEFLEQRMNEFANQPAVAHLQAAFVACDAAWHNYYHWICYGLAKAKVAEPFLPQDAVNIVPSFGERDTGQKMAYTENVYHDSISLFDLKLPVVKFSPGIVKVDRLYFMWTLPRLPPDILILPAFKNVFKNLSDQIKIDESLPRRIFLSRRQASSRRFDPNFEEQLVQLTSQFGFKTVVLEDLSFNQQIALFRNATHIISPHGAAFTNLLFKPERARVLEINYDMDGQGFLRACFYLMAEENGHEYMYLNSTVDDVLLRLPECLNRFIS